MSNTRSRRWRMTPLEDLAITDDELLILRYANIYFIVMGTILWGVAMSFLILGGVSLLAVVLQTVGIFHFIGLAITYHLQFSWRTWMYLKEMNR